MRHSWEFFANGGGKSESALSGIDRFWQQWSISQTNDEFFIKMASQTDPRRILKELRMPSSRCVNLLVLLLCLSGLTYSQTTSQAPSGSVINIHVSRSIETVNYWARGSTKVDFVGTALMPRSEGSAKVESQKGALAVDADFKDLQAPSTIGSPFLVYVLWAITPEGRANNLGQLVLKGNKSSLSVTTKLQTFGMIVTAEP
jgi:hypothetical protein